MRRVLTAVVLIPLVLLLVFRAPLWLFALAVTAIIVLALHEYLNIVRAYDIKPVRWPAYVFSVTIVVGLAFLSTGLIYMGFPWGWSIIFSPAIVFLLPVIFGLPVVFRKQTRMALPAAAASAFGLLYIALPLGLLIPMRHGPGNHYLIVLILFSVWAGDIAAFYVGRSLGRHQLAAVVSPKKSWEGAIASVIAGIGVAALVFRFHAEINSLFTERHEEPISFQGTLSWSSALLLGLLTNVAAQCGDLFESALKRGANIKDSGTLLPGHGGILDRIDALLFAIPVVWYYATFSGLVQHYGFYHLVK